MFAKKLAKTLAILTQSTAKFVKILSIALVLKKNANFFAENWQTNCLNQCSKHCP
jgi:hypothetical protein